MHKAPGPSSITIEFLALPSAAPVLAHIFNVWLSDGKIDASVCQATFVPLYKNKGDPADPGNFRGISIQEHVIKVFMKLLLSRISSTVDKHLLAMQAGFRVGRSATQQCAAINALQHIAHSRINFGLCCGFIDFSKAFDSVNREKCAKLLEWWSIPKKWIQVIMCYWSDVCLQLRLPDEKQRPPIHTKAGVLKEMPSRHSFS